MRLVGRNHWFRHEIREASVQARQEVAMPPKRRVSRRMLASLAVLLAVCSGRDWKMFGYGPEHTSFNSTETAISADNVATLVRSHPAHDGAGCGTGNLDRTRRCSTPAIANGSIFVGTIDGEVVARDANTATRQWRGHTGGAIWS